MSFPNRPIDRRGLMAGLLAFALAITAIEARADSAIDLDLYARLLQTHTRSVPDIVGTRVDYRALRESPEWARLVQQVHSARPSRLKTRDQKLAFWINAYNILAIDLVAKHYPVSGIKEIGSFLSPVWDREVARIEGQPYSLGSIEHGILRKMGEPRIHAAIVCASVSCPPLSRKPFRPETLDADLSAAMKAFLANRRKGFVLDRRNHVVRLSKIFDWFEDDFASTGGVLASIMPHLVPEDAAWLRAHGSDATIRYFDYDWSLNDLASDDTAGT
ncbi:MAG TPA: DUF547 domain-containing protein [Deltaproteobacteria bacterium]|nr:DUF547 domain-containing protein [Deltaproteobacteria bacterium]